MTKQKLAIFSFVAGTILFISPLFTHLSAISTEGEKYLQILHEINSILESDFVDSTEDKKLYQGAIKGAINSLGDPHTRFMDEDEFKSLQEETRGSFGGVGLEVVQTDGVLVVVSPIDDTPASRAGIQPQDRILEINGESTEKLSINDAVKLMRGAAGTSVSLKIRRKTVKDPFVVSMERELIRIQFLKSIFLEKEKIGYIRLTQFMGKETTIKEFQKILVGFKDKKMEGLVVDLRSNPGGLLEMAIILCDMFLESGKDILSVKGRGEKLINVYKASNIVEKYIDLPMVVLLNGGSASASEIFAGAMQDHKRAKIIGTQSFGKGSVQNIYPLSHKTGIAVTIQKYYTPSGVSIHKKGITPDELVSPITPDEEERLVLDKILKANLIADFIKENPGYSEANSKKFQELLVSKNFKLRDELSRFIIKKEYSIGEKQPIIDREFDIQLNRAVELLQKK